MTILSISLILARIAWVTPLTAKLQGQPITYETFNKDTKTYCNMELRHKTFLAPKIVTAFLEFVETHKEQNSNPYTEQTAREKKIIKDTNQRIIETMISSPEVIKVWSYEYTSEEISKKLEQYFKKDLIKVSTVAAIIVEWHKIFTASLYTNNYMEQRVNDVKNKIYRSECREGMLLQIILHIDTFPPSQQEKIFQTIFQTKDSIPDSFLYIDDIWVEHREKQISSYAQNPKKNVDTKLLRILNEYSSIDGFLCDHYNNDTIRGPRQLENMYNKIILHATEFPEFDRITLFDDSDEAYIRRLQADLYIGHITDTNKFSALDAAIFYKKVITLLHQRLQLQDQTGDNGMQLLFSSLSKSRLNHCFIGGVLRFFQLSSVLMKDYDTDGIASTKLFRYICTNSYPWENDQSDTVHMVMTPQFCVRSYGKNRDNVQMIVDLMTSEWDSGKALEYWRSRAWETQLQSGINEVALPVNTNENGYNMNPGHQIKFKTPSRHPLTTKDTYNQKNTLLSRSNTLISQTLTPNRFRLPQQSEENMKIDEQILTDAVRAKAHQQRQFPDQTQPYRLWPLQRVAAT